MEYTHLSDDHKKAIAEQRLLELEAAHYKITLELEGYKAVGDEMGIAQSSANLERIEAAHKSTSETLSE